MFFSSKPKLIRFEEAREVLLVLLRDVGEEFWFEKLAALSAYSFKTILGGMGSFSDLVICPENGHRVSDEKEPLANELVSCLISICYITARCGGPVKTSEAVTACGDRGRVLNGWCCLSCGHGEVSYYHLRAFMAAMVVREMLSKGVSELISLWKAPEDCEILEDIAALARDSGISVTQEKWMRGCPKCASDDIAAYRWILNNGSFERASDNID